MYIDGVQLCVGGGGEPVIYPYEALPAGDPGYPLGYDPGHVFVMPTPVPSGYAPDYQSGTQPQGFVQQPPVVAPPAEMEVKPTFAVGQPAATPVIIAPVTLPGTQSGTQPGVQSGVQPPPLVIDEPPPAPTPTPTALAPTATPPPTALPTDTPVTEPSPSAEAGADGNTSTGGQAATETLAGQDENANPLETRFTLEPSAETPAVPTETTDVTASVPETEAATNAPAASEPVSLTTGISTTTTANTEQSGSFGARTSAVAVLCGILLVIGLLAIGIVRAISRPD